MTKILLIFILFTTSILANKIEVINDISYIPKNKNVLLIFAMENCPYCKRQEKSILKRIKPKFQDIVYVKVMKNSKLFNELLDTANFGEAKYFPTTFILKIDDDNTIDVKYLFRGMQRSTNIISVLNDKDIMED